MTQTVKSMPGWSEIQKMSWSTTTKLPEMVPSSYYTYSYTHSSSFTVTAKPAACRTQRRRRTATAAGNLADPRRRPAVIVASTFADLRRSDNWFDFDRSFWGNVFIAHRCVTCWKGIYRVNFHLSQMRGEIIDRINIIRCTLSFLLQEEEKKNWYGKIRHNY